MNYKYKECNKHFKYILILEIYHYHKQIKYFHY